ncbi:MAG: FAD-dependent oxidoreductase [Sandaracinaceae bacterium]|nr:FAD-dependent oxidoreductase [Sandaracinaceae bacterium]
MTTKLPIARSESVFEDYKSALNDSQAAVEANRCLYCYDAPCIKACPTEINIPEFIRKIATNNVRGSAKTIFDSNILGMSCARVCPVEVLCVGDCVYNAMGVPPIQIGKLQRYATDIAYAKKWQYYEAGKATGKSVGLIGAGPASLAAAHELRRYGHACTVYEKRDVVGGLNTTGVAPYKMKADRAVDEVEWILSIGGIDVKTGVSIPDDVSWDELAKKHNALFLGFGLGPDSELRVPGQDFGGVYGAVDYIEKMKLGLVSVADVKHAVVVGGGNTAIDAVRELRGLGIESVTMIYRGVEIGMSGYQHEWNAAKEEGVRALWRTLPTAFDGRDGRVSGVRCISLDDQKQPINGTEHALPAQLVLLAIGQAKLDALVKAMPDVKTDKGRIAVDANGFTGRKGVFAGGDAANGGKEVVNAAAEGKRAARAIHEYLVGGGSQ